MSRYTFIGKNPQYRVIVGWDNPLGSFFLQVEDLAFESKGAIIDPEAQVGDTFEEGLLVWLGADVPITDVTQIITSLAKYATIPEAILVQLRQDQLRQD
jgi:hypothetical protein